MPDTYELKYLVMNDIIVCKSCYNDCVTAGHLDSIYRCDVIYTCSEVYSVVWVVHVLGVGQLTDCSVHFGGLQSSQCAGNVCTRYYTVQNGTVFVLRMLVSYRCTDIRTIMLHVGTQILQTVVSPYTYNNIRIQ